MKRDENGFITPALLIVTVSLCVLLSGISLMLFSKSKKVESIQKSYIAANEMNELLYQMVVDFQNMKNEENDSIYSAEKTAFLSKYADYNLSLKDVSTGFFIENLSDEFLNKECIKSLLNSPDGNYKKEYGWFNERLAGSKKTGELRSDFGKNDVLPLINQIPYYNVNEMDVDFLDAVFTAWNIKDSRKKAEEIYNMVMTGEITIDGFKKVLKINDSSDILQFIGLKTVFWSLEFEKDGYICDAVVAGVPERELNKIGKYVLVERHIEKRNLINE